MLVSLNWLEQYVNLGNDTPEALAEKITKTGIEVDAIHHVAQKSEGVVVGYVEDCYGHPNADKLNVCDVNVGEESLQIVCGAPNVAKGQKVAVALPGAVLPGNFKIKKTKLRGVESNGMICSLNELGIEEAYLPKGSEDGIFVFPDDVEVGQSITQYLNLDDVILEFDLTPNRSDALSMLGVAYEVAAILDEEVKLPLIELDESNEKATDYIDVDVQAKEDNPYYGAFMVKNITVKPSPLWMRNYLMAAGIRPINNVVDITNFVLLEYGQPLHAFDYDKFNAKQVLVRRATKDETINTLDDQERVLNEEHLVITNGEKPTAIAGVMGGSDSEVDESTTTVLLEAAYFEPKRVRRAVKDHQLRSESSARFEKGVDPNRVKEAGQRAASLLQTYANGQVLEGVSEFDQLDRSHKQVEFTSARVNARLGTSISDDQIGIILDKLGFTYQQDGENFVATIPTRRQDIVRFEDMLEEVARIYGYDQLDYTLPQGAQQAGGLTQKQSLKRYVKSYMEGAGLMEAITYSLTSEARSQQLVSPEVASVHPTPVRLSMPMSEEHSTLRLSALPEMLATLSYNSARKQQDLGFYELGSVFVSKELNVTKQPEEQTRLAAALTGQWLTHAWQQEVKKVDFFLIKGVLEGLFERLGVKATYKPVQMDGMHPGRTAQIYIDSVPVGFVGQIHPLTQKAYNLKETYVFDIDFDHLATVYDDVPRFEKIARYPSISRDVALVVDESVTAHDLIETIEQHAGHLLKSVHVFDQYQGDNLEDGKKSLAFNLLYLDPDRTLTDDEVEASYQAITEAVAKEHQASLRS
ncbi:phenylalanyl-tRNA synthetase beta subunit [Pelagirhabdus alkalitolerans]|uniref:Phenylalanine--tRNA ligase beta subunit n=1 Tax=Pelagirhabdus alkalitolerans TaxID=1612202 RepID=A0A1G6HLE2_9BACI|nr:phenylalanine--tRNA ligase subunit beta [Pelagirhabdus alkalitolerans]SDB95041.1 phenylalanyl-tRNA synthetase beta subunit [Pelagirhabdus alkalitolerans]